MTGKYCCHLNYTHMDELYDLQSDPYEMKNLIGDPRSYEILESLRVRLNKLVGRI